MDSNNSNAELIEVLQKSSLFGSIPSKQLLDLIPLFKIQHYDIEEFIINESDPSIDLYVIWQGEVEVLKKTSDDTLLRISTLKEGDIIGEMGLIDNSPRSASIRTLTPVKVLAISIADLQTLAHEESIYNQITNKLSELINDLKLNYNQHPVYYSLISNLSNTLSKRVRDTNQVTVESLKNELMLSKARVVMSRFMLNMLFFLALYMYAFKIIENLEGTHVPAIAISIPLILVFGIGVIIMMKTSGFSLEFYGITLKYWRQSLRDSILVSIFLVLFIIFIKWLLITLLPQFSHLTLIHLNTHPGTTAPGEGTNIPMLIAFILGYLIFTPIQELIARGALQSCLQEFLTGPARIWLAIIMSNILFSVTHLHISLTLAVCVLLPGLLWGWMFSRYKTLVGVSFSHLVVGGLAFFVFDIGSVLVI